MSGRRRIAIVGSGQAGLLAAHGLRRAGCEVALYSDRTAERWLHGSRPTGTAARFEPALAFERELGLAHWEAVAPPIEGVHLTFCPAVGNRLITLAARVPPGTLALAIDLRLQSHRWMTDLEALGGRVVVETIDLARLDAVAAEHDLTIVAAGRGPLAELFPRHAARSVYTTPQRKLAMVIVTGVPDRFDGVPFRPAKFNLFAPAGEAFWIPYHHRDHGPSWCLLFEAKAGGPMDRFDDCKTGDAVVARAKEVIAALMPWDSAWVKDAALADADGWLVGAVTPTVRDPVGRLASGRAVMALGDTSIAMDPIAGQGANLGNKAARHLVAAVAAAAPDTALDAAWMTATFEAFWADHGAPTVAFNNALLEPLTPAGKLMMIAQYGSTGVGDTPAQRIADAVVENFLDPRRHTQAFLDKAAARALIAARTGGGWRRRFLGGAVRVGGKQLGRVLGIAPSHPTAPG
jgi:2-polyprenyl-6-methoxyphenol hydroxylase-like FAD-dependent oxidoreductase